MASCATPRVSESKGDTDGRGKRKAGELDAFPLPFLLRRSLFFVFLLKKRRKKGEGERAPSKGAKRACCRGGRGMKGIVEPLPPTSGALRWARSVDNAPIRRCVPKKRDTIYRRNPKLREILGRVLARVPADSAGGGLRVVSRKLCAREPTHFIIARDVSDNRARNNVSFRFGNERGERE